MQIKRKSRLSLLVPLVVCFAVSGCFIRLALISSFTSDLGVFIDLLFEDVSVARCDERDAGSGYSTVECIYNISTEDGFSERTSTATLLSKFGLFGLIIDPLIIQVPEDVQVREASYSTAGGSGPLVLLERTSVPIDSFNAISAEPGHKFVILDLPAAVSQQVTGTDPSSGLPIDYAMLMERNRLGAAALDPFDIKAVFTIPFDVGSVRYYLPMFPCVSDMAQVPGITIDPATANADGGFIFTLLNAFQSASPCTNRFFDFESGPQLVPGVSELNFGTVSVGDTQTRTLTLKAAGDTPLVLGGSVPPGGDFALVADFCPNTILPGGQCDVTLSYAPTAEGMSASSIRFATNEPLMSQTVNLTGAGLAASPTGGFSCSSIDFGGVDLGQMRTGRVALWNTGTVNLNVSSLSLAGSGSYSMATDECTGATIAPSNGCIVEVVFAPFAAGMGQAQLSATTNAMTLAPVNFEATADSNLIHASGFERNCLNAPVVR